MSATNELRVFISSTFRDLQEEREHLVKKIFPEIRALCRERGIVFTEVDLRWGLTDEDVGLGRVIRTCLEEVDRCRPYFIGITGDRYGFVPTYLDIQKDPALLAQYPWIEEVAADGMSITEMEAHYALLGVGQNGIDRAPAGKARFYFRRHRQTLEADAHENEELQRLEAYRERIRASGASIEQFRDPASLGEMIYDDLATIIKQDFADARPPTPLEQERSRHEAFAQSRRRAYIASPVYLKRLNDHAASDDPPLVVYAESGSGKSSLFAFWAEQYRRKNPEAHIIEHYVGIGATATDHYGIIRHVCMEITERFARDEEIPTTPEELERAFGQWLGYADHELNKRGGRMVLILDALNQLQGNTLNLQWLPDMIAPSIRLILSSTVEGTLVELRRRGWSQFGMQALTEAERETIVVRYLAEYHKSLNPQQIKRIASNYKCGHPLFLKTVLEELRLVGRHEELDAKIASYLSSTGTEDLFQRVLERLEDDYSQRTVREMMGLVWASRGGLDERELSDLTGLSRLKIASMIAGLDYHLVRKEGRLTFFHDYLRRAVEKRYLSEKSKQRELHMKLVRHFQGQGAGERISRELAWQLHAAGDRNGLVGTLAGIEHFMALYAGETQYEVLGYWAELVDEYDIESAYGESLAAWRAQSDGEHIESGVLSRVAELFEAVGRWEGAMRMRREQLSGAIERGERSLEAEAHRSLGRLLLRRGENEASFAELERARDLYTELGDRSGLSMAIGNMGVVYHSRGENEDAMECYRQQERICRELGDRGGVLVAVGNMGNVYLDRGEYNQAMECYRQLETIGHELGDRSRLSWAINNMGIVYKRRGEYERAMECYRQYETISRELGDRAGVLVAVGNMGSVYLACGEYDQAMECFRQQEAIAREVGDRGGLSVAIGSMGDVYHSRGEYERALESYRLAAEGYREIGDRYRLAYGLRETAGVLLELLESGGRSSPPGQMPGYLPAYVPDAREATWHSASVHRAHELAEECVAISTEISHPDTLHGGRVLLARAATAEGRRGDAAHRLTEMLADASDEDQQAELHYWLWKLGVSDTGAEHRIESLRRYRSLNEKTPKHDYRKRIEELTADINSEITDAPD